MRNIYEIKLPFGKFKGKTVNQLLETKEGRNYLVWSVRTWLPKQKSNNSKENWERLPLHILESLKNDL